MLGWTWRGAAAVGALGLALVATPVWAAKRDFVACDGLKAPPGKDDGAGINVRATDPYGLRMPFFGGAASDKAALAACDAALADPRLQAQQGLRRAHLLRARAVANLALADFAAARRDLDAAEQASADYADNPSFARSMGLSYKLLRAATFAGEGAWPQAEALVGEASAQRPYSLQAQLLGASALGFSRACGAAVVPLFDRLDRLGQDTSWMRFNQAFARADYAAALAVYRARGLEAELLAVEWAPGPGFSDPVLTQLSRSYSVYRTLIETGHLEEADKARLAAAAGMNAYQTRTAALRARMLKKDDPTAPAPVPTDQTARVSELFAKLAAASPPADKACETPRFNRAAIASALPAPDLRDDTVKFKQSKRSIVADVLLLGGSPLRPDGFRERTDKASGDTVIEFTGQSGSAEAIGELTLLRAAQVALAQGKPALLIRKRNDLARNLTTTINGVPSSSAAAGYKTELYVRFVDPAAPPAEARGKEHALLDARAVIAALEPIYRAGSGAS